jgi:hypothetical protein
MKHLNALNPDISVDYLGHPAFASLPGPQASAEQEERIGSLFLEVDQVCDLVVHHSAPVSARIIEAMATRVLSPLFDELAAAAAGATPDSSSLKPALPDVFRKTFESLVRHLHFKNEAKTAAKRIVDEPLGRRVASDLRTHGLSLHSMPAANCEALWSLTASARQTCAEARASNPHGVCGTELPRSGGCWELITETLASAGFIDALALCYGYQMAPAYFTIVHSYPGETWYKGCYADADLPTGRCTYMHYDHADDMPKAIVYVGDVGPDNGPFSVVPGSNSWHPSYSQGLFFKFLDRLGEEIVRRKASYDPYHRPQFKDREFRTEFVKLPRTLQGSSHFGDDVVDGTPLADFLIAREFRVTSDVANCMLFSGHSTVHRGGLVESGERWAFQIGFRKV